MRKVVMRQIFAVLTYGAERYPKPSEGQKRLMAECARWIVGAWRGSSVKKCNKTMGLTDLEKKRIRYMASGNVAE